MPINKIYILIILIFSDLHLQSIGKLLDSRWNYKSMIGDMNIRYKFFSSAKENSEKEKVLFVHGFGGNSDQFRKNMPYLATSGFDSYAIDLLGYGLSDKPNPKQYPTNYLYNFDTWADQTTSFIKEVVQEPCYLVCNSVGGMVGLQAALQSPQMIKGVILINISLRMLNIKKQPPIIRPFVYALQVHFFQEYFYHNISSFVRRLY